MRVTILAALLSAGIGPAMALSVPPPGDIDPHIRKVSYDQMNRTVLVGEIGRETTITFGAGERIGRVVFGQPDAELWAGPDPKDVKDQALQNNLPPRWFRVWVPPPDPARPRCSAIPPPATANPMPHQAAMRMPLIHTQAQRERRWSTRAPISSAPKPGRP